MGLDICVRKLIKEPKVEYDYFRLIDDDGNYDRLNFPEWTKDFENEIKEVWYDWEKYKEETGIDVLNMIEDEVWYGEYECYMKVHPKDMELPKWNEEYPDGWDAYKEECDKIQIKIDLNKVPTKKVSIKIIYYQEVGYQRKGLNDEFYQDYENGKIGYWVWTKEELERYKRDYCDDPYEEEYPNGEKTGDIIDPKNEFQTNIIDEFQEGRDCVIFSW